MFGREEKVPQNRLTGVQYVILGIFALLAFGLWRLQIIQQEKYETQAQMNRVREVPILAPRGKILDREGRIIVDNYPSFSALLLRDQKQTTFEPDLDGIAAGLHLDPVELRQRVKRLMALPGFNPIFIKYDVTPDELAFIESHRNEYPELDTITVHRRLYPKSGFAAHLIGYVGEVSEEMLNQPQFQFYGVGDIVGQSGVEKYYNDILMGQNGSRRVLVNSRGKEVGELSDKPATPGKQLKLTIDIDLQIAAEEALANKNGAIVAMDPRNGEILAMVSHPSYDPNDFAVKISRSDWNKLVTDPNHPLMNRAIQNQLAPGSTFKILMSVAGLQEGVAQDMKVVCNGGATFFGHFYACDKHHGVVDIQHAIPWSCDTYYYTLANRLGIDTIARYAHSVGLGQKTGIDLPNEASGIMPSTEWKLKNYHEKWFAGETISVGIGQGAVTVTPIQLARYISGIASNGHFVRPHTVDTSQLPSDFRQQLADSFPGSGEATIPLDPANWETITDGMAGATDPTVGGTAGASHLEGVDFAGKTGTAQVASHEALARMGKGVDTRPNGWFVGVIPRRNPEFVVAVLWEHGDWGSNAAKLAAEVATVYVNKQRTRDKNVIIQTNTESKPVEMGALWTESGEQGNKATREQGRVAQETALHGGHFLIGSGAAAPAKALASSGAGLPWWLEASLTRFKEGLR